MPTSLNLRINPERAYTPHLLAKHIATHHGIDVQSPDDIVIRRRSIDARARQVMVNLTVDIYQPDEPRVQFQPIEYNPVPDNAPQAIVVGAGPAGLFAALELIESGIRPILLERGKDVDARKRDLANISRQNIIDPNSNYSFGEGGAGAYSDGKLYTRSKKRGDVDKILRILHQHGAQHDILVDAHPHIGTDRLPGIIKAIRQTIIRCGGSVFFNARVTDLIISDHNGTLQCDGAITHDGKSFHGPVILATGHSARDVYQMLLHKGIEIQPKGLAVGLRLEHPQHLVDSIMYHCGHSGRGPFLPPAEYSLLSRIDDRAVYSFCMCPGGIIVPAASDVQQIVVNGMSPSNRGTKWANSGMVVEILPDDLPADTYDLSDPLRMMKFQTDIERRFYTEADGKQNAPSQRMLDFVKARISKSLPNTSYAPGIHSARVDLLLPPFVARRLQKGFIDFGKKYPGFLTNDAIVIGPETRTSSPVRIPRDNDALCHIKISGLYPCGEGAGYAGGIVSAAIDGQRCARAIYNRL